MCFLFCFCVIGFLGFGYGCIVVGGVYFCYFGGFCYCFVMVFCFLVIFLIFYCSIENTFLEFFLWFF